MMQSSVRHTTLLGGRSSMRPLSRSPRTARIYCKYEGSRPDAIIIGGGIAGLLAANVLSRRYNKVLMVERDDITNGRIEGETFEESARRRRGVPQTRQPHQLLGGSVEALDTLLPGFRDETIAAGGVGFDMCKQMYYFDYDREYPRVESGIKGLGVSRRFLEERIRDRVLKEGFEAGTLELIKGSVKDFLWEGNTVTGVMLGDQSEINATLVVDASGRTSTTADKLAAHRLPKPRMVVVNPNVASASRIVRRPKDWEKNNDWIMLTCKSMPNGNKYGSLLPAEDDCWQVLLGEWGGVGPIPTEEGFLEFTKSLPDPMLYNILRQCEPVSDVAKYVGNRNEMVCYHEIDMPRGLLAVGDSVMRMNSLYGLGIAASSVSIVLLEKMLDQAAAGKIFQYERDNALATIGAAFQPALIKNLEYAWNVNTRGDLRYPSTVSETVDPPSQEVKMVTDLLMTAAQTDPRVWRRSMEMTFINTPVTNIFLDPRTWGSLLRAGKQLKRDTVASAQSADS